MKLIEYEKRRINPHRWVQTINELAREYETFSVLHYGCGDCELSRVMTKMPVKNYDPGVPGLDAEPLPEDIVVCDRVLEFVDPEEIDAVIEQIKRVTNTALLVSIRLNYSPDHRTQNDIEYWLDKLTRYFDLQSIDGQNGGQVTMVLFKRVEH